MIRHRWNDRSNEAPYWLATEHPGNSKKSLSGCTESPWRANVLNWEVFLRCSHWFLSFILFGHSESFRTQMGPRDLVSITDILELFKSKNLLRSLGWTSTMTHLGLIWCSLLLMPTRVIGRSSSAKSTTTKLPLCVIRDYMFSNECHGLI